MTWPFGLPVHLFSSRGKLTCISSGSGSVARVVNLNLEFLFLERLSTKTPFITQFNIKQCDMIHDV